MLFVLVCFLCSVRAEEWTREKVIAAIEDPPLRDIFESAAKKLEGLKADTHVKEVSIVFSCVTLLFNECQD
jgi:hypothetical protein